MNKIIKSFLAIVVIAVALGFIYLFLISPEEKFQSVYLVPGNAACIIESEDPFGAWGRIVHSQAWNFLKSNELLADINKNIESIDSVVSSKRFLLKLFGKRKILLSSHNYKPGEYEFLFVVDLKKASRLKNLKNYLNRLTGDKISFTQRSYKEHEIFEMFNRESGNVYYFSFIKNQLIFSSVHTLIEASIDQLDKLTLGRDLNYIEVSRRTSGKGLFSICINHHYFRDYITTLLGKSNDLVDHMASYLYYTGASFALDESGNLQITGYTSMKDTAGSYIQSLMTSGQGTHDVFNLAPARTASLVNIGFGDASKLYRNINASLDEQTRQSVESTIRKTEKKLKINVEKNLLSWMDDEMVLLQTKPSNLGRQNEFAIMFKAKNIQSAQENLDILAGQVKKNSPVRFREIQYKGHVINYLHIPGIFKLLFGKLLARIEKPYYTMIDRFVIFSNHPQTIKSIIDDYESGNTLAGTEHLNQFTGKFSAESVVLLYFQTPVLFSNLKGFVSSQTWASLSKNKKYFECFPNIGIQIEDDKELLKFDLLAEFNPVYEAFVPVTYRFEPVSFYFEDTVIQFPYASDEPDNAEPEIVIDDLDASRYEEFFDNGNVRLSVELKDGLKHGAYREYYENGELKVRGRYRNDLRDGVWKYFDENGKETETRAYSDGVKSDE
ncbi:MAG TPA: DUF3352 domain-containing protein [Bacteroidales bacterium]|nr:DUF3352 domain-containing protein [Bacteroidales bacterium]